MSVEFPTNYAFHKLFNTEHFSSTFVFRENSMH